jgi:hypothetical protein
MVVDHVFGKGDDIPVLGFLQSQFRGVGVDVDDADRIGDMRDLRVPELGGPREGKGRPCKKAAITAPTISLTFNMA